MPTSSQNTNTIAMLPASTSPSMLKQNSDRYWKNGENGPGDADAAVGQRHFVVGHLVQLVVHVAHGVEVNARGDQRHHAEHADGQRVDVVADRQSQAPPIAETAT
jgi:hypothetical protein